MTSLKANLKDTTRKEFGRRNCRSMPSYNLGQLMDGDLAATDKSIACARQVTCILDLMPNYAEVI